jgi:predicted HAD superfamily Cof-like phosphohydrolase
MELIEMINCVRQFHDAFSLKNENQPTGEIPTKDLLLRYELSREENEEYLTAALDGDLTEIADAIGDQLYIILGTILRHGLQDRIEEVFMEIQRSNMSKLDSNGQAIYREDGKVLKSDRYSRPDIASILSEERTSVAIVE